MYRFFGSRSCGKTKMLLEEADKVGGVVICSNPDAMRIKARSWGYENVTFMSYLSAKEETIPKNSFIDEYERFLKTIQPQLKGYTHTIDEDENRTCKDI